MEEILKKQIVKYINKQDPKHEIVNIDEEVKKITYAPEIICHNPIKYENEGYVRAFLVVKLVTELGYSVKDIELEKHYNIGSQPEDKNAFIDIVVRERDNAENVFLFIECKAPEAYESNKIKIETQLFNMASIQKQEGKVSYLVYYSLEENRLLEKMFLIDLEETASYKKWIESKPLDDIYSIPANYGRIQHAYFANISEAKNNMKPLDVELHIEDFKKLQAKLHNVLWGGGSTSYNDIFFYLMHIFLAKIYDELWCVEEKEYEFQFRYEVEDSGKIVLEKQAAKAAGGLKIIGTERHESRRIDNQLRGRSGRQGDPGESRFYISLEDDLMRLFASDKLMAMFNALKIPENERLEHSMLSKAIEGAQKKVETNNFGIRKNLLDYDQVMNEQRETIYAERRKVLDGQNLRNDIIKMMKDKIEGYIDYSINGDADPSEWKYAELNENLIRLVPIEPVTPEDGYRNKKELIQGVEERAVKFYAEKEAEFPVPEHIREIERVCLLKAIDTNWMNHIDDMDQLRQGIGLNAYGQKDPLVEYKMQGYDMFDNMIARIQEDTVRLVTHVKIEQKAEKREQVAKVTGTNRDESTTKAPVKREDKKIQRNDPCPCGSGLKYKNCCGRNA